MELNTDQERDLTPQRPEPLVIPTRPSRDVFARQFPDLPAARRPMSTTIARPQSEVFAILRNVGNFPMFFENLERVEILENEISNWHFKGEEDYSVPIQIRSGLDGDLLVWKSLDAAGFVYTLAIHLEPAQYGRGTVARLIVTYDATSGAIASIFEKMFGADATVLSRKNLQRLKAFCETGNVPTTEGQPSGREEDLVDPFKH